MSRQRLNIILIFVLASLAALVMSFPWELPRENTQSARNAVGGGAGTLEVRGGIDTNRLVCPSVGPCPVLNLWYVFHNRSGEPIAGLRIVSIRAPGFLYDPQDAGLAGLSRLPASLAAQAAASTDATLRPRRGSGRYNIELVYAWASSGGGELRGTIALGPVEISTWWQRSIYNSARRIKDLGLPLVLAGFGWWLQREQKKRDDLQQDEQRKRDALQQDEQRKRDALQQEEQRNRDALQRFEQKKRDDRQLVLTTLLPTHVRDTKRFYLPMAARAHGLIDRLDGVQFLEASTTVDKRRIEELRCAQALFALLRTHRFVVQKIGGVQFSGHDGEKVVQLALRILLIEASEYRIPQDVQDRMLKSIGRTQTFGDFLDLQDSTTPEVKAAVLAATAAAVAWITDPSEPLVKMRPVLVILREVLLFEMDLPMELWYQEPRMFPADALTAASAELERLAQRDTTDTVSRNPGIEAKRQGYLTALRKRLAVYTERETIAGEPGTAEAMKV